MREKKESTWGHVIKCEETGIELFEIDGWDSVRHKMEKDYIKKMGFLPPTDYGKRRSVFTEIQYRKCDGDYTKTVEWIKEKFPDLYAAYEKSLEEKK